MFRVSLSALVLLVLATSVYLVFMLQSRFGGYDLSPLIDSGWRVLSGQRPNRDFICTFPPVLYLGAALAFRLFGVHWLSLSLVSVCYTLGLTFLGLRLLSLLGGSLSEARVLGLSFAFAALEFLPTLVVGHPWHSSWGEDAALYAILATFAVAISSTPEGAFRRELLVHLGLAEFLLLLGKPNTALPTFGLCMLVLSLRPQRVRNLLYPLAGALFFSCVALFLVGTNLLTTYRVYFHLSTRLGTGDSRFAELFSNPMVPGGLPDLATSLAALPSLFFILVLGFRALRSRDLAWVGVLALGSSLVTLLGLGTNVEFHLVDLPCLILGAALLGAALSLKHRQFFAGGLAQSLLSLVVIGFFHAQTRSRMEAVGVWGRDSCGPQISRRDRFFGRFSACAGLFTVLSETDAALSENASKRVFFGPRMEFLYARDGISSPIGLPLWWHPGSSYPEKDTATVVREWEADRFDLLLFPHNDRTRVPQKILDDIARDYRELPPSALADGDPEAHVDIFLRR